MSDLLLIYRYGKIIVQEYESGWIYCALQGFTYIQKKDQIRFKEIRTSHILELYRDKNNKHDQNAIAILDATFNCSYGYLPRELAVILAPRIDKGEQFLCEKVKDLNGARVRIKLIKYKSNKLIKKRIVDKRLEDLVL